MESLGPFKVTTTALLTISCAGEAKTMLVTFMGKNIQDQTTLNIEIRITFITLVGEAFAKLDIQASHQNNIDLQGACGKRVNECR